MEEKKKKEISPERKKQLLEQLKKAREKAAANRKAKAEAKKAAATKEAKKDPVKKAPAKPKKDPRDLEIERLNQKIKNYTLQDIARQSKPAPKPKKIKTAVAEDTHDEIGNEIIVEESPKETHESEEEYVEPKRTASPKPIPTPPEITPPPESNKSTPEKKETKEEPQKIQASTPPIQKPSPPKRITKNLYKKKRPRR